MKSRIKRSRIKKPKIRYYAGESKTKLIEKIQNTPIILQRKKVQKKTSFNPTGIKYNQNNISSHTYISDEASSRRNRNIISYVFSHQFLSDEMK